MRIRDRWIPLPPLPWVIGGIVFLFFAAALFVFIWLPQILVADADFTLASKRIEAENDVRTTGLQFLGGAVLALGALFTGITVVYNRESQLTERFTRAIDQLGHDAADIRMGGIYALERIARDSRRDHAPVIEILITYVRENARLRGNRGWEKVPPDIQAALTVIGRRMTSRERKPLEINLSETNLVGADLSNGSFSRADFTRTKLRWADLTGVEMRRSTLSAARLDEARLERANLSEANLDGAYCWKAKFADANLTWAHLKGADLREAVLWGVDLSEAFLFEADIHGAHYDAKTTWPSGFDPADAGARGAKRPPA
jgi:hypothetical protein